MQFCRTMEAEGGTNHKTCHIGTHIEVKHCLHPSSGTGFSLRNRAGESGVGVRVCHLIGGQGYSALLALPPPREAHLWRFVPTTYYNPWRRSRPPSIWPRPQGQQLPSPLHLPHTSGRARQRSPRAAPENRRQLRRPVLEDDRPGDRPAAVCWLSQYPGRRGRPRSCRSSTPLSIRVSYPTKSTPSSRPSTCSPCHRVPRRRGQEAAPALSKRRDRTSRNALKTVRGGACGDLDQNPEEKYQPPQEALEGPRRVKPRQRKDRPRHRPRSGDPPRHSGPSRAGGRTTPS